MNKHVVIALVVTPILAVLAWFAVGAWLGEKAKLPEQGQRYPLVAKSNCRYPSGFCTLENNDFSLIIRFGDDGYRVMSKQRLSRLVFAVGDQNTMPVAMTYHPDTPDAYWFVRGAMPQTGDRIYLVAEYQGALFFGDAATEFVFEK